MSEGLTYFLITKRVIVEEQLVVQAGNLAEAHAAALEPEALEHWVELPARVEWHIDPAVPREDEEEAE